MIQRDVFLKQLIHYKDNDLIKVITGIRHAGKTILLFNLFYKYLLNFGIKKSNVIAINFESNAFKDLRNPENFLAYIKSKIKNENKYYLFVDEVQLLEKFEEVINSLKVEFNLDIYLTSSHLKLLSKIDATLKSRFIEIKVDPLNLKEIVEYTKADVNEIFWEYIRYGGLPAVIEATDRTKKLWYLSTLDGLAVVKDIIERYGIRNEKLFLAVYNLLCSSIGSYVSPYKLSNTLKSKGYTQVTDDTVANYLEYLCDSYLFYKVYRYDVKNKVHLKTLNKYYVCDLGMSNVECNFIQPQMNHAIENIVYLELIRRNYIVNIGKNRDKEISFVAKSQKDIFYIQIEYTLTVAKKKLAALNSFKNLSDGYKKIIITMDKDSTSLLENGYKKLNLYDFLLNEDALELV